MRIDLLLEDPAAIKNIFSALGLDTGLRARCRVSPVLSWDDLEAQAVGNDSDLVFVQPSFPLPSRTGPDGILRLLHLSTKLGPGRLIPYICHSPLCHGLLQNLQSLPAPITLIQDADDDPRSILRAVARSWARRRLKLSSPTRTDQVDASIHESALAAMIGWPPPRSASDVASRLHLSDRTHRRLMKEAGYPSPVGLVRWGRLLEAIALWRLGMRSKKQLATILGMGRADALSALARSLTGYPWEIVVEIDLEDLPLGEIFGIKEVRRGDCA